MLPIFLLWDQSYIDAKLGFIAKSMEAMPQSQPRESGAYSYSNHDTWGCCVGEPPLTVLFLYYSSGLRSGFICLLIMSVTWLLALLSINSDAILFHYLFVGFNCFQVIWVSGHSTIAHIGMESPQVSQHLAIILSCYQVPQFNFVFTILPFLQELIYLNFIQ